MNNLSSIIQILFIVLAVGGPAIGAIVRKMKEHAEQKRLEAERNKRRIEALRRGRPMGDTDDADRPTSVRASTQAPTKPSRPSAEELAARRQAQIEELRRRYQAQQRAAAQRAQQQRAGQGGAVPAGSRPSGAPTAGGPAPTARPAPTAQPAPSSASRGHSSAAQRQADIARRRAEVERRRAEAAKRKAAAAAARPGAERRQAAAKAQPKPSPRPAQPPRDAHARPAVSRSWTISEAPRSTLIRGLQTAEGIRAAILLGEVLGPPVGLRPPAGGPTHGPAASGPAPSAQIGRGPDA